MFEQLTNRLSTAFKSLIGQKTITESNLKPVLANLKNSLLEADVALSVVQKFLNLLQEKAIGTPVAKHLNLEQAFIKIVHENLMSIMGNERVELNFKTQAPAIFLLAGLQGSGKTTTAGKLAQYIKENHKKNVMLVSTDIYRPAAIEQLATLAKNLDIAHVESSVNDKPEDIVKRAIDAAKKQAMDVLIIDTAGRMHIDKPMMQELKSIHKICSPIETLFVIDSMTGQDAVNTATTFNDNVPITGIILTKMDGDARGGAALSATYITKKPIKFIGTGEKSNALEAFYPERIASRILGMGDVLTLMEAVEKDKDNKKLEKKIKAGKTFNFNDFKQQLKQMNNLGGFASIAGKLPGMSQLVNDPNIQKKQDQTLKKATAIIDSMTAKERLFPKLIAGSRKSRIAKGSGTTIPDVNQLLKQFEQMQKMLQKISKPGGMKNMMRNIGGMMGNIGKFPQ